MTEIVPSHEQKEILSYFSNEEDEKNPMPNVEAPAAPGAGKSRTLLFCAEKVDKKNCLLLTYNKRLQIDVEAKARRQGLKNLEVKTYHSAAGKAYGRTLRDDQSFSEALKSDPEYMSLLKCDVLMLDEVQDMIIAYYLFIEKIVKAFPKIQLLVVGDPRQSINKFMGSRVEFLTHCRELQGFNGAMGRPWVKKPLTVSYRLTPKTAKFVNNHIKILQESDSGSSLGLDTDCKDCYKPIVGGNLRDPDIEPTYLISSFASMAKDLCVMIRKCIKKYGHENVAIIAPSTSSIQSTNSKNPLSVVVREFLTDIPLYISDGEVINEEVMRGKMTICTWSSMKGCEKDCVIVYNFDESYFKYFNKDWDVKDRVPDILYVVTTRARKELVLVADPSNTLRTIDLSNLARDTKLLASSKIVPTKKIIGGKKFTANTSHQVPDLIKHLESSIVCDAMSLLKVNCGFYTENRAPPEDSDDEGSDYVCPEYKAPNCDDVKFLVEFGQEQKYVENISPLYGIVIPAIAELKKTGKSKFASKAHLPKIVESIEQAKAVEYSLTRSAYNSFPVGFWDCVKSAYKTPKGRRTPADWFQLAVAENAFRENGHHIARQIKHYEWINERFLNDSVNCVVKALEKIDGCFEKDCSMVVGRHTIGGMIDFFDRDKKRPWEFKCSLDKTNDHVLQLACYMALCGSSSGILYTILSGRVYTVEFVDTSPDAGREFLKVILKKFDKKETGNLMCDIEEFKKKYNSPLAPQIPPTPPTAEEIEGSKKLNDMLAFSGFLNL